MFTFREFLLNEYEGEDDEMMSHSAEMRRNTASDDTEERFMQALEDAIVRVEEHGENRKKVAAFFARHYGVEYDALLDAIENVANF